MTVEWMNSCILNLHLDEKNFLCVCQLPLKYRDELKKSADEPNVVSEVTAAATLLNMLNLEMLD